jgi:hypothetical protein
LENARPTALQTQGTRKATFPTRKIPQEKGKEKLPKQYTPQNDKDCTKSNTFTHSGKKQSRKE